MSLKNTVPQSLLERDRELYAFIEALDEGFSSIADSSDIDLCFRVESMKQRDVDRWLATLGWKQNWPVDKRKLLNTLFTLYKYGGTYKAIVKGVEEFIGIEVISIDEAWPEAYKKGQNISDEEKCAITVLISKMPYGDRTEEFIPLVAQVCEFLKPVHAIVTVIIHRNRIVDVPGRIGDYRGMTIKQVAFTNS